MKNGYEFIFKKKVDKFWKLFNLLQLEYDYIEQDTIISFGILLCKSNRL